jgi:hypothetical protein
LTLFNLFLVSEGKRKKRWIGLNLRVLKNLVNPIFENRNSIKKGTQAKEGLRNQSIEKGGAG